MTKPFYRLIQGDNLKVLPSLQDKSIDGMFTDPPYGLEFMGKDWDRAVPPVEVWKECFRVLKDGAFAFIMSSPRLDCLSQMATRLQLAGFEIGGFPKSENISLQIDKRECRRQLTEKLGRKPTKEEFDEAWKNFREVIKSVKKLHISTENTNEGWKRPSHYDERGLTKTTMNITIPKSEEAKQMEGSYGGFQPKPTVEVIIVAMKPLSEGSYVDQALKSGKGVTWLDNARIPYENESEYDKLQENRFAIRTKREGEVAKGYGMKPEGLIGSEQSSKGRFPANLLVSDNVLNDGKIHDKGGSIHNAGARQNMVYGRDVRPRGDWDAYGDSGSFSHFFNLDRWWSEKTKELRQLDKLQIIDERTRMKACFICGYVEPNGCQQLDSGLFLCDEHLISGEALDSPKEEWSILRERLKNLPKEVQKVFPFLIVPKASKTERDEGLMNIKPKTKYYGDGRGQSLECFGSDKREGKEDFGKQLRKNIHPTVKPLALMSYLITLGSREGDVVLDPFLGSGTTMKVAIVLGRSCVGIEILPEYCLIAKERCFGKTFLDSYALDYSFETFEGKTE